MSQRRRLFLTFLTLLSVFLYLFVFSDTDNHDSWMSKLLGDQFNFSSSKSTKPPVDEIYGVISLVTRENDKSQRVLSAKNIDLGQPIDLNVYGTKRGMKWEKELQRLNEEFPVVVFSKVRYDKELESHPRGLITVQTYCPYSRKAKQLLQAYQLSPPPKIIEVDLREDAAQLKTILTRLTLRSTFPNILLRGKSIGGSDDLHALHNANALRDMFEEAGVDIQGDYM
ncbi:hypothetical protein J3R30DRAFT_3402362 [Lentinula aciculospora]|uniref:Glutaredoxin domain-containing protein n=1 Tax=Lentinula aciculospora TaxID=153920 RepID=A0A9W9DSM3_9AGAR|nr:hypothetical protein J3R30DRAFT_3402362 [Lentinula aciculospora]